jgi:hypothetical protein
MLCLETLLGELAVCIKGGTLVAFHSFSVANEKEHVKSSVARHVSSYSFVNV